MKVRWAAAAIAATAVLAALAPAASAASLLSVGVTDVTSTSARVTWSATYDLCFVAYDVQVREQGAEGWVTMGTIDNRIVQNYTVTGLKPSTRYEARVLDTDCGGNRGSNEVPFRTTEGSLVPGLANTALAGLVALALLVGGGAAIARGRGKKGS
jgi:hypothetical protein